MIYLGKIRIYYTNVWYNSSDKTEAALTSDSVPYIELKVTHIRRRLERENSTFFGSDFTLTNVQNSRYVYEITTRPLSFNVANDCTEFDNINTMLNRNSYFLVNVDFPDLNNYFTANTGKRIEITEVTINETGEYRQFVINAKETKTL